MWFSFHLLTQLLCLNYEPMQQTGIAFYFYHCLVEVISDLNLLPSLLL